MLRFNLARVRQADVHRECNGSSSCVLANYLFIYGDVGGRLSAVLASECDCKCL